MNIVMHSIRVVDHVTEVPEIEETGSAGVQEPESGELIPAQQESPFPLPPITETVQGLAATRPRSMGGEVAANLISGSFTQISNDYAEAKSELRTTRDALDSASDELSKCRVREAVLKERVSTGTRGQHLRNVAIVGGTTLFGIGFELNRNKLEELSFLVGGIGLLLILMGWFWPTSAPNR